MARPKNCVFIAIVPPDWKPVFYHDVPPAILGGEFYVRSVSLSRALTVAQEYNKHHSPSRQNFEGRWAVVIKGLKAQSPSARVGLAAAAKSRKGGN